MSGKQPTDGLSREISRLLRVGGLIDSLDSQPTQEDQQRVLARAMEVLKPYDGGKRNG